MWRLLRNRNLANYKFRRQQPIGPFVVDFYCHTARLVVELDGGHHADQVDRDRRRTQWMENRGYVVLRFWDNDVLRDSQAVLEVIASHLESPSP